MEAVLGSTPSQPHVARLDRARSASARHGSKVLIIAGSDDSAIAY
jgi:hypothetical protein